MSEPPGGYGTVRIPADINRPDRVLGPATGRQVVIVGAIAAGLWCLWLLLRSWVAPLAFLVPATFVLALVGVAVSTERDGLTIDRLLVAAVNWLRTPRRQVMAPEGVTAPPGFLAAAIRKSPRPPSPLALPVRGVDDEGLTDLGPDGVAILAQASTVNFGLRTPDEQDVLLSGFARWLNSLTGHVQITSANAPADIRQHVAAVRERAPELPSPLLEQAAIDHADYLDQLAYSRVLLTRSIHIAMREPGKAAAPLLARRARDAAGLLAACEIRTTPLAQPAAADALVSFLDPDRLS